MPKLQSGHEQSQWIQLLIIEFIPRRWLGVIERSINRYSKRRKGLEKRGVRKAGWKEGWKEGRRVRGAG